MPHPKWRRNTEEMLDDVMSGLMARRGVRRQFVDPLGGGGRALGDLAPHSTGGGVHRLVRWRDQQRPQVLAARAARVAGPALPEAPVCHNRPRNRGPSRTPTFFICSNADPPARLAAARPSPYIDMRVILSIHNGIDHAEKAKTPISESGPMATFLHLIRVISSIIRSLTVLVTQHRAEPANCAANSLPTPLWRPKTARSSAAGRLGQTTPERSISADFSTPEGRFPDAETGFFAAGREIRQVPPGHSGLPCRFPARHSIRPRRRDQVFDQAWFFDVRRAQKNFFPEFSLSAGNGRGDISRSRVRCPAPRTRCRRLKSETLVRQEAGAIQPVEVRSR